MAARAARHQQFAARGAAAPRAAPGLKPRPAVWRAGRAACACMAVRVVVFVGGGVGPRPCLLALRFLGLRACGLAAAADARRRAAWRACVRRRFSPVCADVQSGVLLPCVRFFALASLAAAAAAVCLRRGGELGGFARARSTYVAATVAAYWPAAGARGCGRVRRKREGCLHAWLRRRVCLCVIVLCRVHSRGAMRASIMALELCRSLRVRVLLAVVPLCKHACAAVWGTCASAAGQAAAAGGCSLLLPGRRVLGRVHACNRACGCAHAHAADFFCPQSNKSKQMLCVRVRSESSEGVAWLARVGGIEPASARGRARLRARRRSTGGAAACSRHWLAASLSPAARARF